MKIMNIKIPTLLCILFLLLGGRLPASAAELQPGQATLYILRKSVLGAIVKYPIAVNDVQIGKLGSKKYFECTVPAGTVTIAITSEKSDEIQLQVEDGRKYYVVVNTSMGIVTGRASLARLSETDGASMLQKCRQDIVADLTTFDTPPASSPALQTTLSYASMLSTTQQNFATVKHAIADVAKKKDEILLSEQDKKEIVQLNEALSAVNNSLYAVANDNTSAETEKMTKLQKIDAALGIIDNRIRLKYSAVIAMEPRIETAAPAVAPSAAVRPAATLQPDMQPAAVAAAPTVAAEPARTSDVDINIPTTNTLAENTFALIIANEHYEFVDDVQFALNDGETFKEYCIKTLGIPERQVWFYKNASAGIIMGGVDKMVQAMSIFDKAKAIVYYCGHGIPDEKTGDAYIVPVDGKGTNTATCYSLAKLYKTLSATNAASVTYFMDACFTGANRDGSMLVAARGVAREAKKETIEGNTIVFSAASGDETAMPFKEKQHGLFTYFLLKKLQQTQGNVSYGELAEYINSNVRKEAFLTNEKPQNPVVATSPKSAASWKNIRIR